MSLMAANVYPDGWLAIDVLVPNISLKMRENIDVLGPKEHDVFTTFYLGKFVGF